MIIVSIESKIEEIRCGLYQANIENGRNCLFGSERNGLEIVNS
jgi:hypothetical protein